MFHSPACWNTRAEALKEFGKLTSNTARVEAVKEQIRIRVLGFGWTDLQRAWSKNGGDYTEDQLLEHLIDNIIPEQKKRSIPTKPTMELPSRKKTR